MLALQLTAKHMKRAQNARKRHFSAQYAVLLMCALLYYTEFVGFLRMLSRFHVRYARIAVRTCRLLLPRLRLAVQRYDTKTILTNFCVKISQ